MNIGIKSDDRLVSEITGQGNSQAKGLELENVVTIGGYSYETEHRCTESYAQGRNETKKPGK